MQIENILLVAVVILVVSVIAYKVTVFLARFIRNQIDAYTDRKYAHEIEAEKARTEELLKQYEMETKKTDIEKDDVYTKIF